MNKLQSPPPKVKPIQAQANTAAKNRRITAISFSLPIVALVISVLFLACNTAYAQTAIPVNLSSVHQVIEGFGAATAFQCNTNFTAPCNTWTPAETDMLYCSTPFNPATGCTQNGIGLSIIRAQIDPDSNFPFNANLQAAVARGARVFMTPWTAPSAFKSNNSEVNGGSLCDGTNGCGGVTHYNDWATYLANYIFTLKNTYNIPVYAISAQNEPDHTATYQSMLYTSAQFDSFIKNSLGPKMASINPGVKIIMPEQSQWNISLAAATQADGAASNFVNIIAAHGYNQPAPGTFALNIGQELWETEDSDLNPPNDASIANGLSWANTIHNYLTAGNINAWNWWWAVNSSDCSGQGLINDSNSGAPCTGTVVAKRFWTTGNWSNWVRPGWVRVDAPVQPISGVYISAFKNPITGAYAIIALNRTASSQAVTFSGVTGPNIVPYVTSATLNLAAQTALPIVSGAFTTTLAASSVTTFAPPNAPLSNTVGWHRIPATAPCGGGPENNTPFTDPDTFPANLTSGTYSSYGFGFTTNCKSFMDDSNSAAYDTLRHRWVGFGGGHQHAWGNDLLSLEMTSGPSPYMAHLTHSANPKTCPASGPASTIVTEGDGAVCQFNVSGNLTTVLQFPACSYASGVLLDGSTGCVPTANSPASVHTYNGWIYIPPYDEFLIAEGATIPNGNATQNAWLLKASSVSYTCAPTTVGTYAQQQGCNPQWTPLGNPALNNFLPNANGVGVVTAFDPNTNNVFLATQTGLSIFNPATNLVTSPTSPGIGYHSSGVIDPIHKYFILLGPAGASEGLEYFSIATGSTYARNVPVTTNCGNLTLPMTTPGTLPAAQYQGMVWDPIARQVVIYPNGSNVIWTIDPATWTCTQETYGSTQGTDFPQNTETLSSTDEGTFGHFQYDPSLDLFVLCGNDAHQDCWYLRRAR